MIRHQRVHAVDRDELLGQRERHAGVIGRRPGNPGEDVVVGELRKEVLQPAEPSVPGRPQAGGEDVPRKDGARPLRGVNLREQRRVDQAGLLEQPLVVPERIVLLEHVADGVVLEREQRVQQAEPHPAVLGEPGDLATRDRIDAQPPARADQHLAFAAGTERRLRRRAAAIDVRAVPPVRVLVDVGRRPFRVGDLRRIGRRLRHAHGRLVPLVAVGQRDVVGVLPATFLVHEPVVDHELDPRRRDDVEDRRRLEGGAGQELEADLSRAGRQQIGRVGERLAQGHVAPEAHAGTAHPGTLEVVVGAVARAYVVGLASRGRRGALERRLLGVVEVLLAQLLANLVQPDALARHGEGRTSSWNHRPWQTPRITVELCVT